MHALNKTLRISHKESIKMEIDIPQRRYDTIMYYVCISCSFQQLAGLSLLTTNHFGKNANSSQTTYLEHKWHWFS